MGTVKITSWNVAHPDRHVKDQSGEFERRPTMRSSPSQMCSSTASGGRRFSVSVAPYLRWIHRAMHKVLDGLLTRAPP